MSEKIDGFLKSLEEQADGHHEIVVKIRELVAAGVPDTKEVFKYGGLHYTLGASPFGGIYAYRNHVTLELSHGAYIDDPYGHLEGKGGKSGRKHVRLVNLSDVEEKRLAEYLALAWETY
ncbi:MAG: DUF1801 domain-containing protein [Leucobacter sp.]